MDSLAWERRFTGCCVGMALASKKEESVQGMVAVLETLVARGEFDAEFFNARNESSLAYPIIAPVGLVYNPGINEENQEFIDAVTNFSTMVALDEHDIAGALVVAFCVAQNVAADRLCGVPNYLGGVINFIKKYDVEMAEKISVVKDNYGRGKKYVFDLLKNDNDAMQAVPGALYCFAKHPYDFGKAVNAAASQDMRGIVGAISGALNGIDKIPRDFFLKYLNYQDIMREASKLSWNVHGKNILSVCETGREN